MYDLYLVDESSEEGGLLFGHLSAHLGIIERHGADHTESIEQGGNLECVFHRIALSIQSEIYVIADGLSCQGDGPDAASEAFELWGILKIRIEASGEPIGVRDGENWRACYAFDARLHARITGRRSGGCDGGNQVRSVSSAGENDSGGR